MNEFLRKAKQASQSLSSFSKVHVVIGNEACDLDSTVSAITHAYHLSQDSDSDEAAIIPVLNIPADEVPLRTESTHLLPRCNIQLTDLVCKDDIDLKSIPNLTLTLVDHNVPADSDTWLDQYVVEVIDHRVNSRHDDEDRVISITREMVGSCCTLVARQILDKHLEILDHQLVKLLLGTILLDTLNLSEAAGRTTPTDEDVVQRLGNLSPRINLQELFNEVQAAKFNISGLTTAQMLRKDFKSTSSTSCKVGFSSVTLPLQDVLDRQDLETSLKNFCEHRFLDVNIIMTIDLEGTRQLAIYSEDQSLRETMEERLQGSVLDLERIDSNVSNLSAFDQQNRKASRKVVLPLVGEILRTLGEGDHDEDDEHGENGLEENVEELSSNVNNANDMAEEGEHNGKAEALDTGSRLLPMSPFDKKSISVDESVTKNLDEEWDEKEAILNAIRAKQEEAERRNMQLEDPGMRQMSMDSEDSMKRMKDVSAEDEWQDDEYARHSLQGNKEGAKKSEESDSFYRRPVPEDERKAADGAEHTVTSDGVVLREKKLTRPNTLLNRLSIQSVNSVFSEGSIDLENISDEDEAEAEKATSQSSQHGDPSGARPKEKRKIRAELSLNLDDTITSQHTDDGTTPAVLTPTDTEMSWEDDTPMNKAEPIEEYSAREEHEDRWRWRKVNLGGKDYTIDMKAINPYKKVLSHGGYYGEGLNAIIVFASCYLPEKSRKDYTYLMNNLFLYVVSTLELLVAQEYIIIYFHGSASSDKIPSLGWMRKCYQMIDRKLRKSLKGLYLVHPTTWLKAIVKLTKPFISAKFSNKLKFVKSLVELKSLVSMEYVYIPEEVKRFDQNKNKGG